MIALLEVTPFLPALTIGTIAVSYVTFRLNQLTARRSRLIAAWDAFIKSPNHCAIELLLRADEAAWASDRATQTLAVSTLAALETIAKQSEATCADWALVLPADEHAQVHRLVQRRTSLPPERLGTSDRFTALVNAFPASNGRFKLPGLKRLPFHKRG